MKLTADRIIDAGMAVFARTGYHGFSVRQVAERLDVHAGSLYYHVPSKAALLQLMADRVVRQAYEAGTAALAALPAQAGWPARVTAQAVALRQSIRQHPGGAIMLAGSPKTLSPGALSLMERLLATLAEAGVPPEHRGTAADTVLSHVTGYVLQEQSDPPAVPVDAEDVVALHRSFPRTVTTAAAHGPDEKFTRSLDLLCAGIGTLIRPPSEEPPAAAHRTHAPNGPA
ncbi:tetracycline repressor protein class H [Streptomyces eurocidicus]|uniref:AcrR family transcriptional regulator n=1 Tax=Streptomyces eurocidicus TaxID=66423 RepID=A0A2N8NVH5_STREU|nr:TetR/AcrR family transcriptional regulator [Streptomyces eurocidicus]MBB5122514.1 AcrR family transcriptional regulator [Streptomyces eurocidicus]MBF6056229.1 TetR family transcriptional regulator [Streptomyces eurocidicus]PNE32749.1 tetracycline repressor protein class H [Streptomyces eurocidicus]